ncbi:unnamed protein product [Lota lota]
MEVDVNEGVVVVVEVRFCFHRSTRGMSPWFQGLDPASVPQHDAGGFCSPALGARAWGAHRAWRCDIRRSRMPRHVGAAARGRGGTAVAAAAALRQGFSPGE